jgi:cation diffusion facilitator family transporter
MLNFLIKIFIKDHENVEDSKVREAYGILTGSYGIFLNILLFIIKYIAGFLSGSISVMADAFNNFSDAGSSLISVIGFRLGGKKADEKHPYGHGRMEYIAGFIVSIIIILMGYELLRDSFSKILHPEEVTFSYLTLIILIVSILIKFYMAFYSRRVGKKINSETLKATSVDALSDTLSTFLVLGGLLLNHFFDLNIDGYLGVLVGLLIIFAGVKASMDTINPLLGEPPQKEFVDEVERIVLSFDKIIGVHDLLVHDYGPGRRMISLHAEVPDDENINELHDIIDNAEKALKDNLNCHAVIHMDPIAVGDEIVTELKTFTKGIVKEVNPELSIHDFRVVKGPTHTNLVFDVLVPYKVKESDDEIVERIRKRVHDIHKNYYCVIEVDRDYVGR